MSKRKTMGYRGGGVPRSDASSCGSSLSYDKLLNLLMVVALCCGLMIPATLTRPQAYADPADVPVATQDALDPQDAYLPL